MGYIHFFDDWKLISYQNLVRRQGKPAYVPEATLEDELCEGTWDFPCVAKLPDGKYIGLYGAAPASEKMSVIEIPAGTDQNVRPRAPILCYAESDDGIHWRKPDLRGIAQYTGSCRTPNQVFTGPNGFEGGPAYYDVHEKDPAKRFKLLINRNPGRAMMVSPDGIHWNEWLYFGDQRATDTPTSVFFNRHTGEYTFNVRYYAGDRRVFFFSTKDWKHYSEPQLIMHPSPQDPPLMGIYAMPVFEYEDLYIGLLWRIWADPGAKTLPNGAIDVDLCYSYDGNHFNRTYHDAFIARNELGEHGGGCVYTSGMIVEEDHIRFYSGGSKAEHFQNQNLTDAALMMHRLRLDGFMYLATPTGKGELRTRALYINGDDLRLNVRSPWGKIRVRILDEKGQIIPGFDYDDCIPFSGDSVAWTPVWKDGKSFGDARSKFRRQLEIEIVTGEIYAIRGDFEMVQCLWDKDEKRGEQ